MISDEKIKNNFGKNSEERIITPKILFQEFPLDHKHTHKVAKFRADINKIIQGQDKRILVILGPCSIHDPQAAIEYASLLNKASQHFIQDLYLVMRVYFEKPRTTIGWKGLIRDPFLNGNFDINTGLRLARKLLLDLNELNIPTATEFLDTVIPQYLCDLISWCAIGARTAASPMHRELASGLMMSVGFKNSLDGNIKIAIDAVQVAAEPQQLLSINHDGFPISLRTSGNPNCHVVLRGSQTSSNYEEKYILETAQMLIKKELNPRIIIDCSHGNSMKNYAWQSEVIESLAQQIKNGVSAISGVMLESNIIAGKQDLNGKKLNYGQSITDACLSWDETLPLLEKLARANREKFSKKIIIN